MMQVDKDGVIVSKNYYTIDNPPPFVDNPKLYTNVQPVMKWNKERTELVQVGVKDVDKEINAAAVGITPYALLERVQHGDASAIPDNSNLQYGDVSDLPTTEAEYHSIRNAGIDSMESLEAETKEYVRKLNSKKSGVGNPSQVPDVPSPASSTPVQVSKVETEGVSSEAGNQEGTKKGD